MGLRVWSLGVRVDPTEKVDPRFVNFRRCFSLGLGLGLGFGGLRVWSLGVAKRRFWKLARFKVVAKSCLCDNKSCLVPSPSLLYQSL